MPLRPTGPFQVQYTVQLASGNLQVAGLQQFPPQPTFNPLTYALLTITGGTGLYTGATGYWQETSPNLAYGPGVATNGFIASISY